jgi:hypothetical protein
LDDFLAKAIKPTELRAGPQTPPPTPAPTELRADRSRSPTRTTNHREVNQLDLVNVGDHPGSLLCAWNRTATSGAGVELLRRRHDYEGTIALLADGRMPVPVVKGYQKQSVTKNDNKGARGKTSKYERECKEHREGIDISFRIEEEHGPVPTKREYVDKASHMRRPRGPFVQPEPTSRLCGCEDLAGIDGLRSDSYTSDIESHHLLYSFAVSDNLKIEHRFKNPKNKRLENVRLSIDVRGPKQILWKKGDGTDLEEFLPATLGENAVRWIDTSCMIVDSLTKKMKPDVTHRLQEDGNLSLKATAGSDTEEACGRKSGTAKTALIMIHDIGIGAIQSRSESTLTPELRV